jgi:hypothetical protein
MDGRGASADAAEDLTAGERLLLWSFRAWAGTPAMHQLVWREFARTFPPDEAPQALRALELTIDAVGRHARRAFVYHPMCCRSVTADERALLAIFAAAQADETPLALRHAAWLVHSAGVGQMVSAASALALVMEGSDLLLPRRGQDAPAPARPSGINWTALARGH